MPRKHVQCPFAAGGVLSAPPELAFWTFDEPASVIYLYSQYMDSSLHPELLGMVSDLSAWRMLLAAASSVAQEQWEQEL